MTIVTARSIKNFQVEITTPNHRILSDEPLALGGDDLGPNPYELLLSSLAACKIITVHMYAQRKNWPVEAVNLTLSHQQIYAKDCQDCLSNDNAKVTLIQCKIHFEGQLDDAQIKRLTDIADRCPVHRTLTSEIKIRTEAVT